MSNSFQNIQGKTGWKSPSNIALVKYWGKHGKQLPRNASVSFTLKHACTETIVEYAPKGNGHAAIDLEFLFDGKQNLHFQKKMETFLESIVPLFPFLHHMRLKISSRNTFPHSTGIASSASSMSALALCLTDIENMHGGTLTRTQFFEKASAVARLGSGSACRSVYSQAAVWGKHPSFRSSSDEHAVPFETLHTVFKTYKDAILIVSAEEKAVSSRAGHVLMDGNPYAEARYRQASDQLKRLKGILEQGDLQSFGEIVEEEALTLHALMMCSRPSYMLMLPNTLKIIELIKAYRTEKGVPLHYTLDAGPNVHLLYPAEHAAEVEAFIRSDLEKWCEHKKVIYDEVGTGPEKII
jgi:diphosphomevalonate decarboxylase